MTRFEARIDQQNILGKVSCDPMTQAGQYLPTTGESRDGIDSAKKHMPIPNEVQWKVLITNTGSTYESKRQLRFEGV